MENKKIILFKRSKNKELKQGIEYILCTNERPTIMSSSLETMSTYVTTLSKVNGKKVGIEYSIPKGMNSGYFYDNLSNLEKKSLKMHYSKKII